MNENNFKKGQALVPVWQIEKTAKAIEKAGKDRTVSVGAYWSFAGNVFVRYDEHFEKDEKMTKEQYMAFHASQCQRMQEITKAKNADYTGNDADPFANFTRVEKLGICSTEQGFLTRMTDKLCRISSFVQKGTLQVKDESVQDTLLDLANYAILMSGFLKSKLSQLQYQTPENEMALNKQMQVPEGLNMTPGAFNKVES